MWNFPIANALVIITECCGPSSSNRTFSFFGQPIMKLPAGTTTISGHLSHSLNTSFGLRERSSVDDRGAAHREVRDTVCALHGLALGRAAAGGATTAGCAGAAGGGGVGRTGGATTASWGFFNSSSRARASVP